MIAGVIVLAWPVESLRALTLVVGVALVIVGGAETFASSRIRRAAKAAANSAEHIAA